MNLLSRVRRVVEVGIIPYHVDKDMTPPRMTSFVLLRNNNWLVLIHWTLITKMIGFLGRPRLPLLESMVYRLLIPTLRIDTLE